MPKVSQVKEQWQISLSKDLDALQAQYGKLPMPPARMLDVELVLTLIKLYFPNESPRDAWVLFNGYQFAAYDKLTPEGRKAVAVIRYRVPWLTGKQAWSSALQAYGSVPAPIMMYKLENGRVVYNNPTALPDRLELFTDALRYPPQRAPRAAKYAPEGRYTFYQERTRSWDEVTIPQWAAEKAAAAGYLSDIEGKNTRPPITILVSDLKEEARWMDAAAPKGSAAYGQDWTGRVKIDLRRVTKEGLIQDDKILLDGLMHMLGMVSSGKSSLLEVLTVYLARRHKRITYVHTDVANIMRMLAILDALREGSGDETLRAVPLIGRSTRVTHLKRLHTTEALKHGISLTGEQQNPGFEALSLVCPLDGLRDATHPIVPGTEPCTKLHEVKMGDDDEDEYLDSESDRSQARARQAKDAASKKTYDCPLMPVCPVHAPTRELEDSLIWLATPASLLASGPQTPIFQYKMQYIELVARSSDVVLVDEADLVQVQFDDRFAPIETLVGVNNAFLDRLATKVFNQQYQPGRDLVGKWDGLTRWFDYHSTLQNSVNHLLIWIRTNSSIQDWLSRDNRYFYGDWLLDGLRPELDKLGANLDQYTRACLDFSKSPLSENKNNATAWNRAVQADVLKGDSKSALGYISSWLISEGGIPAETKRSVIENLSLRLLVSLIVVLIERSLDNIKSTWPTATEWLDIDQGNGQLFYNPPDDLLRMVPEPPMGSVFGFQYVPGDGADEGELRFISAKGLGRHLLYNLHDTLRESHGIAGPHVLLTSGTSWAPGSWKYHVDVPPTLVLMPQRQDDTGSTTFEFEPLQDPTSDSRLTVSGISTVEARIRNLRAMVKELAQPNVSGKSRFDMEFEQIKLIDPTRQRIMLVAGSYEEAAAVGDALAGMLDNQEEVLVLERDRGDADDVLTPKPGRIPRSMLKEVPKYPARFLVAPLQAVERGHNILVQDTDKAAIGAVYFLTRPLPVPNDPNMAIQRVNAWAMQYVPAMADLGDMTAFEAGTLLRQEGARQWRNMLSSNTRYSGTEFKDNKPLLWTQAVLVWQCIGRLLRGGVSARVHFVDARWAEGTARLLGDQGADDESSSMLLGFKAILAEAMNDPNPANRQIAEALYGPFYKALCGMTGIRRLDPEDQDPRPVDVDDEGEVEEDIYEYDYDEVEV